MQSTCKYNVSRSSNSRTRKLWLERGIMRTGYSPRGISSTWSVSKSKHRLSVASPMSALKSHRNAYKCPFKSKSINSATLRRRRQISIKRSRTLSVPSNASSSKSEVKRSLKINSRSNIAWNCLKSTSATMIAWTKRTQIYKRRSITRIHSCSTETRSRLSSKKRTAVKLRRCASVSASKRKRSEGKSNKRTGVRWNSKITTRISMRTKSNASTQSNVRSKHCASRTRKDKSKSQSRRLNCRQTYRGYETNEYPSCCELLIFETTFLFSHKNSYWY